MNSEISEIIEMIKKFRDERDWERLTSQHALRVLTGVPP